ncbi:jg5517 [Pararge aegeria aegeria]|uniref:Jg5517 protein n=1 Tax=Pararge aegeria aegeria TaxID=348720 RepID=A0A8S4SG43_9NEOP|nr:jg5517 [Pararge aegeria aegeria]
MGGARRTDGRWGAKALVSAALVNPQRDGQTSASQGAAGHKRHKSVEFGTPFKITMSRSGRLSVDMMMILPRELELIIQTG